MTRRPRSFHVLIGNWRSSFRYELRRRLPRGARRLGDGGEVSIQLGHQNLEPAHMLQLREYRAALLERPTTYPSEAPRFESAAEFLQRRHDFAARIARKPRAPVAAVETRTAPQQLPPPLQE